MTWGTEGDVNTLIRCGGGGDNPGHVTVARQRVIGAFRSIRVLRRSK